MAVFRIERTRDYTVMSNHHLRNEKTVLKGKGAAFHDAVLAGELELHHQRACRHLQEGVDAIGGALRELETAGYIVRHQLRDRQGRISDTEYVIYEQPQPKKPDTPSPDTDCTRYGKPYMEKPDTEKARRIKYREIKYSKINYSWIKYRFHSFREKTADKPPERKGRDAMSVTEDRELSGVDSGEHRV